jgi:hypothetical protein
MQVDGVVRVQGADYAWEYRRADDTLRLLDSKGRSMASGKAQPLVVVAPAGGPPDGRLCAPGKVVAPDLAPGRVTLRYEGANGGAGLSIAWRFDAHGIWTDPVVYETTTEEDVVSVHYFAEIREGRREAALHASYLVVPGISEGPSVSPIVRDAVHLDQSVWLGRGSFLPGLNQQWGLPVHFFSGFSIDQSGGARNLFAGKRSEAFACGLADLPGGDLFLQLDEGRSSLWIDYRSDLWRHVRGPGWLTLGATLFWAVGPDYYQAIGGYYRGLLDAGVIRRHRSSAKKTAIALTPQYCTWGAQEARNKTGERLDGAFLEDIYKDLRASGMKAGLFSIDDKWEGSYGNLEHSASRLPHFEQFLDRLRADGFKIGLWAALMRCERPADLGLTEDHMLRRPDGSAYRADFSGSRYFILDFTQPAVAAALAELARKFMRRYKPDLLKFDFGYELPALGVAAPRDKNWTGERLMRRGLEIAIGAMREENPDLVVMYYNLSPLFLDYFDLHSTDDLFLAAGEYELEANRRIYFSSLLGSLGIPTYGSSGYDWSSAPDIWFDSAAVGTLGSLNDFREDEEGEGSAQERVARYNGLAQVLRSTETFEVAPLGSVSEAPTLGAHARSWARFEEGELVLLAYRPSAPGEDTALDSSHDDPRTAGIVRSSAPVVVASRDSRGIGRSGKLGVVPCGGAEVLVRRQAGNEAETLSHYFGGNSVKRRATIHDGWLRVVVDPHDAAGKPLEWIEVQVS